MSNTTAIPARVPGARLGAINLLVDPEARLVHLAYLRNPTFEEFRRAMDAAFCHPDYEPGFGVLIDRRAVEQAPSRDFARAVVDCVLHDREWGLTRRWAALVRAGAQFGMARMMQTLLDLGGDARLGLFTEYAAAAAWLAEPAWERVAPEA